MGEIVLVNWLPRVAYNQSLLVNGLWYNSVCSTERSTSKTRPTCTAYKLYAGVLPPEMLVGPSPISMAKVERQQRKQNARVGNHKKRVFHALCRRYPYRACKSRGETMRDFRLPEPFDYRSDILTLKFLSKKSSLCLKTS